MPEPNLKRMACPFCATQTTIPDDLRWEKTATAPQPPIRPGKLDPFDSARQATRENTPVPDTFTENTVKILRAAEPVARQAYSTYWRWTALRPLLPGCLIFIAVVCLLACATGAGLVYLLRQG
jgi:hypothetical protein